jgi:hypothetical protein
LLNVIYAFSRHGRSPDNIIERIGVRSHAVFMCCQISTGVFILDAETTHAWSKAGLTERRRFILRAPASPSIATLTTASYTSQAFLEKETCRRRR